MSKQRNESKRNAATERRNKLQVFEQRYQSIRTSFLEPSGADSLIKRYAEILHLRNEFELFKKSSNLHKKFNNEFILLQLKIYSLFLRIHIAKNDGDSMAEKMKEIALKDLLLVCAKFHGQIDPKKDPEFQEEFGWFLFILLENITLLSLNKSTSIDNIHIIFFNIISKCQASFQKLEFYNIYFEKTVSGIGETPRERELVVKNFLLTYDKTFDKLMDNYKKLQDKPSLEEQYTYIYTLLLRYNLDHQVKMHLKYHHLYNEAGKVVNIPLLKEAVKMDIALIQRLIVPLTDCFRQLNLAALSKNLWLIKKYDLLVLKIMLIHIKICQELKDLYPLLKEAADTDQEYRQFLIQEIPERLRLLSEFLTFHKHYMQICNPSQTVTFSWPGTQKRLEALAKDLQDLEQAKRDAAIRLSQDEKKAEKSAQKLVQEVARGLPAPVVTAIPTEPENFDESSEDMLVQQEPELTAEEEIYQLIGKAQSLFIEKKYTEAISEYHYAKVKAEALQNEYLILSVLDGYLSVYTHILALNIEHIDSLLTERLSSKHPLSSEKLESLKTGIPKIQNWLTHLDEQLDIYNQLLKRQNNQLPGEKQKALEISLAIISAHIRDIYLQVDRVKEKNEQLKQIKQRAKAKSKNRKDQAVIPHTATSKPYYQEENQTMEALNPLFNALLTSSIRLKQKYANKMQVEIPEDIKKRFTLLRKFSEKPCLVGCRALNLVLKKLGKPEIPTEDYDFLTLYIPPKTLVCEAFTQTKNRQVFNHFPLNLQVFSLKEGVATINASFLQRDFSAFSLGIFENGDVIGLTEECLADIENRFLRTNIEPTLSFQQDPVKMLRAIKMELKGWTLDPLLKKALVAWQPDMHFSREKAHICALMKKMLETQNKADWMKALLGYGLMESMFGFQTKSSSLDAIAEDFGKHLQILAFSTSTHPAGFFNTEAGVTSGATPVNVHAPRHPEQSEGSPRPETKACSGHPASGSG